MTTLVDASVLLDLITEDERWMAWSGAALEDRAAAGPLVINPLIYAEISLAYDTIEALDEALLNLIRLSSSVRGRLPCGEVLSRLPQGGRSPPLPAAGLLHRRSRGDRRLRVAHTRPRAVRDVLPAARDPLPIAWIHR